MYGQKSCPHLKRKTRKILGTHGKIEECEDCGKWFTSGYRNQWRSRQRNKLRKNKERGIV